MAVELPFSVSLSLMFASVCAGIFYAGPWGGGLLGLAGAVTLQELRARKPLPLMLVNAAQLFLSGLVSGWVLVSLGAPVHELYAAQLSLVETIIAPVAAVVVFYAMNLLLVGLALYIKTGMSRIQVVQALSPGPYLLSMLILALLGYIIAHLIAAESWFSLLLLVLPFTMARRTFRVYVELTEAYTSTVRSLVTAIEAKDPYTRGHSERVARYARMLAERMGLSRGEVDLLERAALLHDVGKIGISLDTLVSPDRLTEEEVEAIRRHPALGADLVADVEFLQNIVEIIRCHHERCDGEGYPGGLAGDDIPAFARILAVADSYDAMTSDRAYKPRMSTEQACVELSRVSGAQLDASIVQSFTEVVRSQPTGVTST
ncbi:MAG: HD-GYP domain-containing protein [Coriobacteriia bacterium]